VPAVLSVPGESFGGKEQLAISRSNIKKVEENRCPFRAWLLKQADRDDPVGAYVREFVLTLNPHTRLGCTSGASLDPQGTARLIPSLRPPLSDQQPRGLHQQAFPVTALPSSATSFPVQLTDGEQILAVTERVACYF
jgi:hypothetical protein